MTDVKLKWSTAKVEDSKLTVDLDGELPSGWKGSFDAVASSFGISAINNEPGLQPSARSWSVTSMCTPLLLAGSASSTCPRVPRSGFATSWKAS